jgi:hypothetical protein
MYGAAIDFGENGVCGFGPDYTIAKWWQERATRRFAEKHLRPEPRRKIQQPSHPIPSLIDRPMLP